MVGLGSHDKGRAHTGRVGYRDKQKTQNMKVFDVLTPEELIQKSNRGQYMKGIRN
jgi:hypothetical protein